MRRAVPAVALSENTSRDLLVMVALPAVLLFMKDMAL
jgi:hypothetical protein